MYEYHGKYHYAECHGKYHYSECHYAK
jgi:hypothetical protein